ncbi:MAG: hypothetical protein WC364_10980 [Eubacteriales bacterium]
MYSPTFSSPSVSGMTVTTSYQTVEDKNGGVSTSGTTLLGYGVSFLSSTLTSTGYFTLGAPVSGQIKYIIGNGLGSTYGALIYTNSTGVCFFSTTNFTNRILAMASPGDVAICVAVGSSGWVVHPGAGVTTVST